MLEREITAFVDNVSSEVAALSGRPATEHASDVTRDAANLVAAIIDSDGRMTEDELRAYANDVGPLLDPPLFVTPDQLRETRVLQGTANWLLDVGPLLELLLGADRRDGTRRSHVYYERGLRLAHVVAAADLVPSPDELAAIDGFRDVMLRAMDAAGVPRPGTPAATSPVTPASPAARTGPGHTGPGPAGASPAGPGPAGAGSAGSGSAGAGPAGSGPARPGGSGTAGGGGAAPAVAQTQGEASATEAPVLPPARPIEELLAELDALIGLDHVKAEVRRLTSLLQVQSLRAERGLRTIEVSRHLVFTGNPGTGKTTVGRLLAQIYRSVGVVSVGHLVETDRSDLVAGYVGQTATKTKAVLDSALGGMLLIDEAYALARGGQNDFGLEAVDTLVKFMEDHRDDLAIVAAGYPDEMDALLDTNPGLKSRFTRTVHFPDYTDDELERIFGGLCDKNHYSLSDDALLRVRHLIGVEPRTRGFGNARFVRNLFEAAVAHQAMRVAPLQDPSTEHLVTLIAADIVSVDS